MIDHMGIVVRDAARSRAFYASALAPLGYTVRTELPPEATGGRTVLGLGAAEAPDFWISDGTPNEPPLHVAFRAKSKEEVDAFYAAALRAGGQDNGPPGPRPLYHPDYYGAFVRDPDGHNIEAVFHGDT